MRMSIHLWICTKWNYMKWTTGDKTRLPEVIRWKDRNIGGRWERMPAHSGICLLIINGSEQQQRLYRHTEILSAIQGCYSRMHQRLVTLKGSTRPMRASSAALITLCSLKSPRGNLVISWRSSLLWWGAFGVILAVSFCSILTFSTLVSSDSHPQRSRLWSPEERPPQISSTRQCAQANILPKG